LFHSQVATETQLLGASLAAPAKDTQPALTKTEKMMRKQISSLQVRTFLS
jgi:hypothetical protein